MPETSSFILSEVEALLTQSFRLKRFTIAELFKRLANSQPETQHEARLEALFWSGEWVNGWWKPPASSEASGEVTLSVQHENEHLRRRCTDSSHPAQRAQYAHFLWQRDRADRAAAELAMDGYLAWIELLEQLDVNGGDDPSEGVRDDNLERGLTGVMLDDVVTHALTFAVRLRSNRIGDFANAIVRIATQHTGRSRLYLALELGQFMLARPQHFGDVLETLEQRLWTLALDQSDENDGLLKDRIFVLGSRVSCRRLRRGNPDPRWPDAHGAYLLRVAEQRDFQTGRTIYLNRAIAAFHAAGNEARRADATGLLEVARTDGRLGRIEIPYSPQEVAQRQRRLENIEQFATELARDGLARVIGCLGVANDLLPDVATLKQQVDQNTQTFSLLSSIPQQTFNASGNVVNVAVTDEERAAADLTRSYALALQLTTLPLIHAVIRQAVKVGALTAHACTEFLREASWLGEPIARPALNGEGRIEDWLRLLEPALRVYLDAINAAIHEETDLEPHVLFIDSAVTKIEGMVRRLLSKIRAPTLETDGEIQFESDINALLRHPRIGEVFDENNLYFLRHVLIDKLGLNLRHEVSHALLTFDEYGGKAELLFVVVLRVAFPMSELDDGGGGSEA